jgi:UDP-N-acetylmuramoylalanine-D-glutamate ligase
MSTVTVFGAGAWGSTMAQVLSDAGNEVLLWVEAKALSLKLIVHIQILNIWALTLCPHRYRQLQILIRHSPIQTPMS